MLVFGLFHRRFGNGRHFEKTYTYIRFTIGSEFTILLEVFHAVNKLSNQHLKINIYISYKF